MTDPMGAPLPPQTSGRFDIAWGKLGALVVLNLTALIAAAINAADHSVFATTVAASVGYVIGNGRLAARGGASMPTIAPKGYHQAAEAVHELAAAQNAEQAGEPEPEQ